MSEVDKKYFKSLIVIGKNIKTPIMPTISCIVAIRLILNNILSTPRSPSQRNRKSAKLFYVNNDDTF
jgi:hypothetical protein